MTLCLCTGNGTSEIFYRDPTVFIIDIFEPTVSYPAEFVPCSVTDVGLGPGKGYTANISMPSKLPFMSAIFSHQSYGIRMIDIMQPIPISLDLVFFALANLSITFYRACRS